jgi:hypothetical protein
MSHWTFVQIGEHKHVLPCDDAGVLLEPFHTPSVECWCNPKVDDEDAAIIVHKDRERGGADA